MVNFTVHSPFLSIATQSRGFAGSNSLERIVALVLVLELLASTTPSLWWHKLLSLWRHTLWLSILVAHILTLSMYTT